MLSLNFVLPHWLYWAGLAVFPLIAAYLVARERGRREAGRPNLFLGYLFLVTAGFAGMHRFYLRNAWGFVFIPVFFGVLWTNDEIRAARDVVSSSRQTFERSERAFVRARNEATRRPSAAAQERLTQAEAEAEQARIAFERAQEKQASAITSARIAGGILALMLLGDALLLPSLTRRVRNEEGLPPPAEEPPMTAAVPETVAHSPAARGLGVIDRIVVTTGEFVAYWAVIAVFVYYYEVVARYVFNSPTNWVHESMFLMFGMQSMIAGAYAYRDETHVRVDIVYSQLSRRGRAVCDVITSVFFFIFIGAMLVTGWRFASDAIAFRESSFTEWGIQYWPVKLAIPIGAALLLLQGFARLIRDIAIIRGAD